MQKIKHIMSKEILSVTRATTLAELVDLFQNFHSFPLVPVIAKDGKLIGTVSFKNIMEVFNPPAPQLLQTIPFLDEQKEDIFEVDLDVGMGSFVIVEDIMDKEYLYAEEEENIDKAYYKMTEHQCERLPVVNENGQLSGIVGVFDIVRSLFKGKKII